MDARYRPEELFVYPPTRSTVEATCALARAFQLAAQPRAAENHKSQPRGVEPDLFEMPGLRNVMSLVCFIRYTQKHPSCPRRQFRHPECPQVVRVLGQLTQRQFVMGSRHSLTNAAGRSGDYGCLPHDESAAWT